MERFSPFSAIKLIKTELTDNLTDYARIQDKIAPHDKGVRVSTSQIEKRLAWLLVSGGLLSPGAYEENFKTPNEPTSFEVSGRLLHDFSDVLEFINQTTVSKSGNYPEILLHMFPTVPYRDLSTFIRSAAVWETEKESGNATSVGFNNLWSWFQTDIRNNPTKLPQRFKGQEDDEELSYLLNILRMSPKISLLGSTLANQYSKLNGLPCLDSYCQVSAVLNSNYSQKLELDGNFSAVLYPVQYTCNFDKLAIVFDGENISVSIFDLKTSPKPVSGSLKDAAMQMESQIMIQIAKKLIESHLTQNGQLPRIENAYVMQGSSFAKIKEIQVSVQRIFMSETGEIETINIDEDLNYFEETHALLAISSQIGKSAIAATLSEGKFFHPNGEVPYRFRRKIQNNNVKNEIKKPWFLKSLANSKNDPHDPF